MISLTTPTLRLADYLLPRAAYHVARVTLTTSDGRGASHGHDFAELFWVERGSGTHVVDGEPARVEEGDLMLVGPENVHLLRAGRGGGLTIINLAFPSETLVFLRDRYFPGADWPWSGAGGPTHHRLDGSLLIRLDEFAARLVRGPPSRLLLERFLLELLHELTDQSSHPELPIWLVDALQRFTDDREALTEGVAGLAALAGRSREHINRMLRAHTGRTATQTVNEIRLTRASHQLRMTDQPIARVATECGLPNLSHFYRLFNDRFGNTPRRYRLENQLLVRGEVYLGSSELTRTRATHETDAPYGLRHGSMPRLHNRAQPR